MSTMPQSTPPSPQPHGWRVFVRRGGRIVLFGFLGVVVLLGIAFWYVNTASFADHVRVKLIDVLTTATGGRVELARIQLASIASGGGGGWAHHPRTRSAGRSAVRACGHAAGAGEDHRRVQGAGRAAVARGGASGLPPDRVSRRIDQPAGAEEEDRERQAGDGCDLRPAGESHRGERRGAAA